MGQYEKMGGVESNEWPAHVIEEIVAGCASCVAYAKIDSKFRGETVIVQTPATSPLANDKLKNFLRLGNLTGPIDMFVKVMSKDITSLKVANTNVFLESREKPSTPHPYVHAGRNISCTDALASFAIPGPREYPVYPSEELCKAYGIAKSKIEEVNWNVAAVSVMFGMDFALIVSETDYRYDDAEDTETIDPIHIGSSLQMPNVKCITYRALQAKPYLVIELIMMPGVQKHCVLQPVYVDENGDEDCTYDALVIDVQDTSSTRVQVFPLPKTEVDCEPEYWLLKLGEGGKCILQIKMVTEEYVLPRSPRTLRNHIEQEQQAQDAHTRAKYFAAGTSNDELFAMYQKQARNAGYTPNPETMSLEMQNMLVQCQEIDNVEQMRLRMEQNDLENRNAMEHRRQRMANDRAASRLQAEKLLHETEMRDEREAAMQRDMIAQEEAALRRAQQQQRALDDAKMKRLQDAHDLLVHNQELEQRRLTMETQRLHVMQNSLDIEEQFHKQILQRVQLRQDLGAAAGGPAENNTELCVICDNRPKNMLAMPCKHLSCCEECSHGWKNSCMVCRQPIKEYLKIFI